jgi:hypothetical protein
VWQSKAWHGPPSSFILHPSSFPVLTLPQIIARYPDLLSELGCTQWHPKGFHSVAPAPSPEQIYSHQAEGRLQDLHRKIALREEMFRNWADRALEAGYEPPVWTEADALLDVPKIPLVCAFGGNRMSKSWWALKRLCEAAWHYADGELIVASETEDSSKLTAQRIVWHYFEPFLGAINARNKRETVTKVNYSMANGFTDGKLVLPNATTIVFATYKEEPGKYEGMQLGADVGQYETHQHAPETPGRMVRRPNGTLIQNVGFVLDESAPLEWLEMVTRRASYRYAPGLWAFPPIKGMTPAIKDVLGTPEILTDREADLLPQASLPGCRRGYMPRTALCKGTVPGARAIWFHIGDNPIGNYNTTVRASVAGKATEIVERIAYGWARDTVARAFPAFSTIHVVREADLPEQGRNLRVADPGLAKPYFMLWLRLVRGDPPHIYVYRDWPDSQRFGEWAVATTRETSEETRRGWDGDKGIAQNNLGWGYEAYKREWRRLERIHADAPPEIDPYRRRIQARLAPGASASEEIDGSLIDPRAGPTPQMDAAGGTCAIIEFARPDLGEDGKPQQGIIFTPAPGYDVDKGLVKINQMLAWDESAPFDPLHNSPTLFVSERCEQLRWALAHYTGRSGPDAACGDPIDCLRMALVSPFVEALLGASQALQDRSGTGWK